MLKTTTQKVGLLVAKPITQEIYSSKSISIIYATGFTDTNML